MTDLDKEEKILEQEPHEIVCYDGGFYQDGADIPTLFNIQGVYIPDAIPVFIYDGFHQRRIGETRARVETNDDGEQSIVFEWNKPKPFENCRAMFSWDTVNKADFYGSMLDINGRCFAQQANGQPLARIVYKSNLLGIIFEKECINTTEQGHSQSGIGNQDNNDNSSDVPSRIVSVCDGIKEMLLDKNRKYGNSALEPVRVFSKADPIEQIKVRMDDKLSRIRNQQSDEDEDVWRDLAGYIVLLIVAKENEK